MNAHHLFYNFYKLVLIICLSLCTSTLKAQTEKEIQGMWKVKEVLMQNTQPAAGNPAFVNRMKEAMAKFEFNFRPDHHMLLTGNLMGHPMPEGVWAYDPSTKIINITEYAHPGKLMTIKVSKDAKGITLFKLLEAPVTLKVYKL